MKKFRISNVVTAVIGIFVLTLLLSPELKAWVSQGLVKIGLFKPDSTSDADAVSQEDTAAGETARRPSVFFADGDGNRIDVANLDGKVVFINFWATWCPPCIAEMPSIDQLYQQYKDNEGVVFVMVDVDGQYERSKRFMVSKKLGLPVHVPAGEIPKQWLGGAIPTTVILNKRGAVAARHEGMADYSRPEVADFLKKLMAE